MVVGNPDGLEARTITTSDIPVDENYRAEILWRENGGFSLVGFVRWNTAECGAQNRRRIPSQVCMKWALSGINILAGPNNEISCAYDANSFDTNHQLSKGLDGILEVTGGNSTA